MSRKALTAANWKMHKTPAQARDFLDEFLPLVRLHEDGEIVIFPSPILMPTISGRLNGTDVEFGAQNIYHELEGAFTGETSIPQIQSLGATHTLIGHSERRAIFGETDIQVNQKLHAALTAGIIPILCVGEQHEEHVAGLTGEVLRRQVQCAFQGITSEAATPIVIAYEPVWAIGTGNTATPQIAIESHRLIRSEVAHLVGREAAQQIRILYGGSVRPDNVTDLVGNEDVDGALVGGASLEPNSFADIVHALESASKL